MPFSLLPLPELVAQGISSESRIGRLFEQLKQADSHTPLKEPLRAANSMLAVFRHALSPRARETAEEHDYFMMACEVLATEITLRAKLEEQDVVQGLADSANPCVSDWGTLRATVGAIRVHWPKKADGNDDFFEQLKKLTQPLKSKLGVDRVLGEDWHGDHLQRVRSCLVKLLLILCVRSGRLLDLFIREDIDVSSPACLQQLYDDALTYKDHSEFPGCRSRISRQAHTSEQKLWSLGQTGSVLER